MHLQIVQLLLLWVASWQIEADVTREVFAQDAQDFDYCGGKDVLRTQDFNVVSLQIAWILQRQAH